VKHIYKPVILLLVISISQHSFAQNLEMVGKKNAVKITGGISSNQVYYASNDSNSTRDPFSTVFTGNVNFQLYEWSAPFSFTWSNTNHSFQQPFNRYSLHPKYKWVTAHFGYTSMSFSPYTYNGQLFSGVGVDAAPKNWISVSALYGRFQKPVPFDSLRAANTTYSRYGFALKTQVKLPENDKFGGDVSFNVFHARDRKNSIAYNNNLQFIYDSLNISPKENIAWGTSGNFRIFQKVQVSGEFAQSALTRNLRDTAEFGKSSVYSHFGTLLQTNSTTAIYNAYKTNVSYQFSEYGIGVGYERIDPGYATLGAYYFSNDFENVTMNMSGRFLKNKVSANGSLGKQRDNLDKSKSSSMQRWVTSLSLSYAPSQKLNMAGSYSTFQSYTNVQSKIMQSYQQVNPYATADTLNYQQLSQSANFNVTYNLASNESSRKNIMLNLSWQTSSQVQKDHTIPGAKFYNINSTYSHGIVPLNLNVAVSVNTIINIAPGLNNKIIGPSISANKMFFDKKLRATLVLSMNNNYMQKSLNSRITTIRFNGSITIKKKHNLNLSLAFMNRAIQKPPKSNISDFTATMGYSWGF
jgi:hypothetical protein